MDEKSIIQVEHVNKKFGKQEVLKDICVSFASGGIYGIIGRNGSGKSVLFKCICGFVPVTDGKITVNGKVIGKDAAVPEKTGIIIETPGFLPNYSGYKNLEFLYGVKNYKDRKKIEEYIEKVGLDPKDKKHVGKYSLGMKQRLAIAQAIMEEQEILILDEPMNGLDNKGVEDMRKLFMELKESGKTILLASHNREDIEILCDEVYEMDHGVLAKR